MESPFEIVPARKTGVVVRTPSDGSGWKTRAMWLIEAVGGRWVHRSHGYRMSQRQADNLLKLHAAGWQGCVRVGRLSGPARFTKDNVTKVTIHEALKAIIESPSSPDSDCDHPECEHTV